MAMEAEVISVPDSQALARQAARRFAGEVAKALELRGQSVAALSGGSTSGALYRLLTAEPVRSRVS